jgi:iron complex outermembrane recepter protein
MTHKHRIASRTSPCARMSPWPGPLSCPTLRVERIARVGSAILVALASTSVGAQSTSTPESTSVRDVETTQRVTVTGQIITAPLGIGGFGDTPLSRTPLAASIVTEQRLRDTGAKSISDLTRLDAGVSASYDAPGYYPSLSARGFTIDNRANQRRDGLPIQGETAIHLGNKRSLELLKGASGMQSGISAPGGLINYVVKRPTTQRRELTLEWRERGTVGVGVDLSQRFGADETFGARLNLEHQTLKPQVRNAEGRRELQALALDARFARTTLVEVEFEKSRQSQPSVPGFSLLGDTVPRASSIDPRINLNNQAWSLPVVFTGTTGSMRVTHELGNDWRVVLHGVRQRLVNDDRVAFPFGLYDPLTFECTTACDRFAPDGSFTLWEFRSDHERRRADALELRAEGRVDVGGVKQRLSMGALQSKQTARLGPQVFDIAGVGTIAGTARVPPSAGTPSTNTNRDERGTELFVRDALELSPTWTLWAGLRHSRLERASIATDGTQALAYTQRFTTPWLALSHQLTPRTMLYASLGRGVETEAAPSLARYRNAGQPLPALKSRQTEAGIKHDGDIVGVSAALFDITRPATADFGDCSSTTVTPGGCTRAVDGRARHRGAEALVSGHAGELTLHASAMLLDATRAGSATTAINGLRPVNVPRHTLRLHAAYEPAAWAGLSMMASVVHEGARAALPDNSASVPAWTRLDLAARWKHSVSGRAALTWRLGLDNATNARAWKEAPYTFGHAYLFPLAPRTVHASLTAGF